MVRPQNPELLQDLVPDAASQDPIAEQLITCTIDGDLADLAIVLGHYGTTLVMLPEDMNRDIKSRYVGVSQRSILQGVAARLGPDAGVYPRADHVYVGIPRDEDTGLRIYHVPSGDGSDWSEAYGAAATESGKVTSQGDLVFLRDTPAGLKRADAVHEIIASPRRSYTVEVVYAELTRQQTDTLGVDFSASGTGLLNMRLGQDVDGYTATLDTSLQALIDADAGSAMSNDWQTARLHAIEGESVELQVGDAVNVRQRIVSPEGTVTEADVTTFNTGFLLDLRCYAVRGDVVRVELAPEVSAIRSFTDGLPQIVTRRIKSSAYIDDGGVIVLGGLTLDRDATTDQRLPFNHVRTGKTDQRDRTRLFIFIRMIEVI